MPLPVQRFHDTADGTIEVRVESGAVRAINDSPPVRPDVLAGLKCWFTRGETTSAGTGFALCDYRGDHGAAERATAGRIRRVPVRSGGGPIAQEWVFADRAELK